MQSAREITFGEFRLDVANECLWQGTRAISLRPKAFAVLMLLVQNPGNLVTKQQVLDTVWPGTFVGDAVLKDNIRQLREALNDDAGSPAYIETAHRRGYRFIGMQSQLVRYKDEEAALPVPSVLSVTGVESRLLGRAAELVKMRGLFDRALAGDRQIVFVTGEPGIGKTTLVQAFLEQLRDVPGIRVVRGQCLEHYGAGEAYLPVLDGFSKLCRSPGGAQILDSLRQHAPAWLMNAPSLVPQAERDNLQSQAENVTRERMLREMAEAIEMLSSDSAFLLVLEDLHWSDYSTLDLLSYLARRRDPARLMVIGTYRPVDVIVGDHPLKGVKRELQAHGLCHEFPLEYLSESVIDEYLSMRFPGHQFPSSLRGTIHRRTEGNPLFMADLLEYLVDQRVIATEQSTWKLCVPLSQVEQVVPANLRELIEKQIERLSAEERSVLEAASVVGMECSSVAIGAGLEMPVEWVEKHCEQLARRHHLLSSAWLVELPDGTMTQRQRFIHILYRDIPYRLIPPMRRSQMHHRIAHRDVATYGDRAGEIAAELAMHFEQGRDWDHALQYLIQAAQNASRKSAHHESVELSRRALLLLKSLPKSAERDRQEVILRMILSVSLMAMKGFASAEFEEVYIEANDLFRLSDPSPQLFNVLYLRGLSYIIGGNINSALEIAAQLLELSDGLEDPTLVMEAHRAMGSTLIELGKCHEALDHFESASQIYAASRHHPYNLTIGHDCRVLTECSVARGLWALGFPDAALERMQAGVAFARVIAHPQSLIAAAHLAAQLHQLRGEPLLAQERAGEVLDLAQEHGLELWIAIGKIDCGFANAELGNAQSGTEQMKEGLAAYEATGGKLWSPYFFGLLADTLARVGRTEEGLVEIGKALMLAEETGERFSLAELFRIKGELILKALDAIQTGKPPNHRSRGPALLRARDCFAEALRIAQQQGTRSWRLRAALSMARLELRNGSSTHVQLAEILSSFTEGQETADLRQARSVLNTLGEL